MMPYDQLPTLITRLITSLITWGFIAVPLVGALVVAFLPPTRMQGRRLVLLVVASLEVALGLLALGIIGELPGQVFATTGHSGLAVNMAWAPSLGLGVRLAIDHLNVYPLVVIPLLFLVVTSLKSVHGRGRSLGLLVSLASLQGVFIASDLMLLSLFYQTAIFGLFFALSFADDGDPTLAGRLSERHRAPLRFLLFNYTASLVLLAAALLARSSAQQTAGIPVDSGQLPALALPADIQAWIGAAFALFLVIVLPVPPFHRWFVDLFAMRSRRPLELLLIVGAWPLIATYVVLRFALPLCPEPVEQLGVEWGGVLASWVALYGAALALGEHASLRRRFAYVCTSFNGLIFLGLWSLTGEGLQGSLLYALSHGLVRTLVVALALCVSIAPRGELLFNYWKTLLWWGTVLAFLGFPVAAPFGGALLCLVAGFAVFSMPYTMATITGMFVAGFSLLSGSIRNDRQEEWSKNPGPSQRAFWATAVSILALVVCLGLHPAPLLKVTAPAVQHITGWLPTTGYFVIGAPTQHDPDAIADGAPAPPQDSQADAAPMPGGEAP